VDEFKSLNDLYGHLAGRPYPSVGWETVSENLRRRDKVGRFGGDEFMIVLPETGPKGAYQVAERIRKKLHTLVRTELEIHTGVTLSLGVASSRTNKASLEKMLEYADTALYRAKSLGRNRAEVWKKQ